MQAVTTATVQFAVNYVPQCFNASDPYSVLSRFIIIKPMVGPRSSLIHFACIGVTPPQT